MKYLAAIFIVFLPIMNSEPFLGSPSSLEYNLQNHLNKKLIQWSDKAFIVKPKLSLQLREENNSWYENGTISILVNQESLKDNYNLEVILAQEFGKHYIRSKYLDITNPLNISLFCDLLALKLVGKSEVLKMIAQEQKNEGLSEEIRTRQDFIKNNF